MKLCLTDEELVEVTGRQRPHAQMKVLAAMGILAKRRPDGTLAVDRAHYQQQMGAIATAKIAKKTGPDLEAVRAASKKDREQRPA